MVADAGKEHIYHNQMFVFNDVGKGVLANAYAGFNTSLFAYGQTGAGKSYSMVGYGVNKGIVPLTFEDLFKTIHEDTNPNVVHRVVFSMLEIYMEQVSDLITGVKKKGGLKVRQDPKKGQSVHWTCTAARPPTTCKVLRVTDSALCFARSHGWRPSRCLYML